MFKIFFHWYAQGYIQKLITGLTFLVVAAISSYTLEFISKGFVWADLKGLVANNVTATQLEQIQQSLLWSIGTFGFQFFWAIVFMALVGWKIIKFSTEANLVGSVTLGKAIRFTDAMERLGLLHEWEQLQFVRHFRLPVYLADRPLLTDEAENVSAKLYPFVRTWLVSSNLLAAGKGRKSLCLRVADLENVLTAISTGTNEVANNSKESATSMPKLQARMGDLEVEKKVLKNQLLEATTKVKELEAVTADLKSELQIQARKEGKDNKAQKRLFLYTLGLAPVFLKIANHKPDRRDVTRVAFAQLYKNVVNGDPTLAGLLYGLGEDTPGKLPDYICDITWKFLKELELTNISGPAPTGNLGRLKQLLTTSPVESSHRTS